MFILLDQKGNSLVVTVLRFLILSFLCLNLIACKTKQSSFFVQENYVLPELSVANISGMETENNTMFEFNITLDKETSEDIVFFYRTQTMEIENIASVDIDYNAIRGREATIKAGESSKTISVEIIGDDAYEQEELFQLVLSNIVGAKVVKGFATATIINDDNPPVLELIDDVVENEGTSDNATRFAFTVALDRVVKAGENITFDYETLITNTSNAATANVDYIPVLKENVKFDVGSSSKTIYVDVLGDRAYEEDERFQLILSNPKGAEISGGNIISATGVILNDDKAPRLVSLTGTEDLEGGDGEVKDFVFIIALDRDILEGEVASFDYTTQALTTADTTIVATEGVDYVLASDTNAKVLVGSSTKEINVSVIGDYDDTESDEKFQLLISNVRGLQIESGFSLVATSIIENDDLVLAVSSFADISAPEGSSNNNLEFNIVLNRRLYQGESITFSYATLDGLGSGPATIADNDYLVASGSDVAFEAETDSKTITVQVVGDNTAEKNENFRLVLSNISIPFAADVDDTAVATLQDDDEDSDNDGDPNLTDPDDDSDQVDDVDDVDDNGNGLIEIYTAEMLDKIRYDLAGTSYNDGTTSTDNGCGGLNGINTCYGYEIINDIDLAELTSYVPINNFTGTLAGRNSIIKNLNLNIESNLAGFFATFKGTLRDLNFGDGSIVNTKLDGTYSNPTNTGGVVAKLEGGTLENVSAQISITAGDGNYDLAGGLVGDLFSGTVTNSSASGRVDGGAGVNLIGGLVGRNYSSGNIVGSTASGDVLGNINIDHIGGLVGYNKDGTISGSAASGNITGGGQADCVGGLVGSSVGGTVQDGNAKGNVSGGDDQDSVGGLVGCASDAVAIVNSYSAIGIIEGNNGNDRVGGLVGTGESSEISASYSENEVNSGTGINNTGGLVGLSSSGSSITGSRASGVVTGSPYVGGLVGHNASGSTIETSYAIGNVNSGVQGDSIGGLVGYNDSHSSISGSYASGNVDGKLGDDYVGGLVGIDYGTISASFSSGNVNGSEGDDFVGGLIGEKRFDIVQNSYSTSMVEGDGGDDATGGLVGRSNGTIMNSYSNSAVYGRADNDYVGGLLGLNRGGTIQNSYATGNISGGGESDDVGGLVGRNWYRVGNYELLGTIINSYATGDVSGNEGTDNIGLLVGNNTTDLDPFNTADTTSSYYSNSGTLSDGNDSAVGISTNIKALTFNITGNVGDTDRWHGNNWTMGTGTQYPTLRAYQENDLGVQEEGSILCNQEGQLTASRVPCA